MARKKARLDSTHAVSEGGGGEVTRSASRRWKGTLEAFSKMPVDLVDEVLKHLSPLDLLHLARTSKHLRSLVLSKNAIGVWRAARMSIADLPDCPPYMSEPAYANLMFSSHCHQCLTSNVHNIIFPFLVRYCHHCKKSQCIESYLLGGRGGYAGGLTDDMFCTISGERRNPLYHKPDVEGIWGKWLALAALAQDEGAREQFKQDVRNHVQLVLKHSAQCAAFVERKRASRAEQLKSVNKYKLDLIVDRLAALGWGEELEQMKPNDYSEIREHHAVRQLKRINDKTWAEVEKSLVSLMVKYKKIRLVMQRRQQIKNRLALLTDILQKHFFALRKTCSDYGPQLVDFAVMPKIRSITEAPSSRTITEADFASVQSELTAFASDWSVQAITQLSSVISSFLPFHDGFSALLASAFFDCLDCGRRAMQYPAVCAHQCLRPRYYRGLDCNDTAYLYLDIAYGVGCVRHWSCHSLTPSPSIERAKQIIEACGEDPYTIQQSDMDETIHRLCCTTCSRDGVKLIMSWRSAMEHWQIAHSGVDDDEPDWEKVSEAEAEKAIALEKDNIDQGLAHYFPIINGDMPPFISRPVLFVSKQLKASDLTSIERDYFNDGGGCFWDFDLKSLDISAS